MMGEQPLWAGLVLRSQGRVYDFRMGSQYLLELVESLLQLTPIAGTEAWLFAFLVLTLSAIATAPAARGLATIALHLNIIHVSLYSSCMHTVPHGVTQSR